MTIKKAITITVFIVIAFSFKKASAQLCQGSLGDPVVNITFGSGANPGASLGTAVNNYLYVGVNCPSDGRYTISNSINGCFNGTWFNIPEDHTPYDVNGYMMVVNATVDPGDFYLRTVSGLCSGTNYEFASWIMNIQRASSCNGRPIYPNVTFNIETTSGVVLMSYKTGDIPFESTTPTWKQYGSYFATPPGVSTVIIRMTNNAPGGCGNDLALDDITFRPCGPLVAATISGYGSRKDVCAGDTSTFVFTANITSGYSSQFYQWQVSIDSGTTWTDIAGATSALYRRPGRTSIGVYNYRLGIVQASNVAITTCRIFSNVVSIHVNDFPVPLTTNNGPKCEGYALTLMASNGANYNWRGPANFSSTNETPVISNALISNGGKYYVTVTSAAGCVSFDSTIVDIYKRPSVNAGIDTAICEGSSIMLQGSASIATSYLWTPSTGLSFTNIANPIASPVDSSMYVLTITNGVCNNSDSVMINMLKKPKANAGADQKIIQGQSVMLMGSATGNNASYSWTPNYNMTSASTLQPVVFPLADTMYALHVTSNVGCGVASDSVFVRVYKKVMVPNVFSPNNDGINDTWNIQALDTYPLGEVSVYNRYGHQVFFEKGYTKQWNGFYNSKPLPEGVYYYTIDLKEGMKMLSGWLLIVR